MTGYEVVSLFIGKASAGTESLPFQTGNGKFQDGSVQIY